MSREAAPLAPIPGLPPNPGDTGEFHQQDLFLIPRDLGDVSMNGAGIPDPRDQADTGNTLGLGNQNGAFNLAQAVPAQATGRQATPEQTGPGSKPAGGEKQRNRGKLIKALGVTALAVAGAAGGYLAAQGLLSPDHVAHATSALPNHVQLDAFVQKAHHVVAGHHPRPKVRAPKPATTAIPHPHVKAPAHSPATGPKYPADKTPFWINGKDLARGSGADAALLVGGALLRPRKRYKEHVERQHHEHQHLEAAKGKAEAVAFGALLNPRSPAAYNLSMAMKRGALRHELHAHGAAGVTESTRVVRDYLNLIVGSSGNAAGAKKHLEDLFGGKKHAAEHGLNVDGLNIFDQAQQHGGSTVDINLNDHDIITIAHYLVEEGEPKINPTTHQQEVKNGKPVWEEKYLNLGNLPPSPLGNRHVVRAISDLDIMQTRMRSALEHPYTISGGPNTVHRLQAAVRNTTQQVLDIISANLPNNQERELALRAMHLDDLVETYTPTRRIQTGWDWVRLNEKNPFTGEDEVDPKTGLPVPAVERDWSQASPVHDPAINGPLMRNGQVVLDWTSAPPLYNTPGTGQPTPRMGQVPVYKEVPGNRNTPTRWRAKELNGASSVTAARLTALFNQPPPA